MVVSPSMVKVALVFQPVPVLISVRLESVCISLNIKKNNFQVIRFFHRSPAQGSICRFFVCISAVSSQIAVEALAKSAKPAETKNGPKKNSSRITTRAASPSQAAGEASD